MEESSEHGSSRGAPSFWATPGSSARLHSARLTTMSSSRQALLAFPPDTPPPQYPSAHCTERPSARPYTKASRIGIPQRPPAHDST
jgi:hypothetical protein